MMQQVSQRVPRLFLGGSLLALLALLTFNVSTTHAADPCGSPIVVTPGNPGACTIGGNLVAADGDLTYTVDPNLTISSGTGTAPAGSTNGTITGSGIATDPYTYQLNGANQTFDLAFNTTVSDGRGDNTGWSLAASTDLPTNFVTLTGATASCNADSTCFPDPKALITQNLPLTLSSSAQGFISTPISPVTTSGDYSIATTGTLTIPSDTPAGANIAGNVTITLNSVIF
jgi:hypothetical protein